MTTIAYKAGVLAADRMRSIRGTPVPCTKIFKALDGSLYGCSGDSPQCEAFKAWHLAGMRGPCPPLDKMCILHVDFEGKIFYAEDNLLWLAIPKLYWAIGSGGDYAMGAMAAGMGALDNASGLGWDTLILGPFAT